jgi:hypothetical protein
VPLLDGYGLLSLLAHRVLRRAAAVTTVSEFLRRRVVAAVPEIASRCTVMSMPLEVGRFELGRAERRVDPPRVLFAGNLVRSKGVDVLIRAVGQLVRDGHSARLRILGEGPDTGRLTSLVKSLALEDVVEILPFVGQEQMPAEYGAATITVLATRGDAEGLGLTLVEALLAGCAVVGSRAGGIPEIVIPEQTGLAFRDGDEIDLAAQLLRLLTDVPLRERLTDEGARRARETFEASAVARRFNALYRDVAADSSRRRAASRVGGPRPRGRVVLPRAGVVRLAHAPVRLSHRVLLGPRRRPAHRHPAGGPRSRPGAHPPREPAVQLCRGPGGARRRDAPGAHVAGRRLREGRAPHPRDQVDRP